MTSWSALRDEAKVNNVARSAPMTAAIVVGRVPISAMLRRTAIVAPSDAPADVPIMEGSASGLFVALCDSAPATPSAAPIRSAASTRGNLICQITSCAGPVNDGENIWRHGDSIAALPTLSAKREKARSNKKIERSITRLPFNAIICLPAQLHRQAQPTNLEFEDQKREVANHLPRLLHDFSPPASGQHLAGQSVHRLPQQIQVLLT